MSVREWQRALRCEIERKDSHYSNNCSKRYKEFVKEMIQQRELNTKYFTENERKRIPKAELRARAVGLFLR